MAKANGFAFGFTTELLVLRWFFAALNTACKVGVVSFMPIRLPQVEPGDTI
jgi:hypothetical protein